MASWYEVYEHEGDIRCLTIRDGLGELVGVIPLFINRRKGPGLRHDEIGFASTSTRSWGCYLEPLCAPEDSEQVARIGADYLSRTRGEWDRIRLIRVPAESMASRCLMQCLLVDGWQVGLRPEPPVPVVRLPDSTSDVVSVVASATLRKELRSNLRHLAADFPGHTIDLYPSPEEASTWLDTYTRLNITRRETMDALSNFNDLSYRHCFAKAVARWGASGSLMVVSVSVGSDVIALQPYLVRRDCCYLLTQAWSVAHERYGLGHIVTAEAMRASAADGCRVADFLSGGARNKARFTDDRRHVVEIVAHARRPRLAMRWGQRSERAVDMTARWLKQRR
jgi:hypothetical protein